MRKLMVLSLLLLTLSACAQVQRHQDQAQQQQPRAAQHRVAVLDLLVIGLSVDQQFFKFRRTPAGRWRGVVGLVTGHGLLGIKVH